MLLTNTRMHQYIDALNSHLNCSGILGYGIARNLRRLSDAAAEYLGIYNAAFAKYGKEVTVDGIDGLQLLPGTPEFDAFFAEIQPYSHIEHEVDIFQLPLKEAIGQLDAQGMMDLSFMLVDTDAVGDA